MTYEMRMYDLGRAANQKSAQVIVGVLWELFHPQSVIDVGCGEGWFLDEFAKRGVKRLVGVDANPMHIPAGGFIQHDLTQPFTTDEKFDLALCVEVAEHVPAESANTLVETLCALSDAVVFSGAIPKQGGHGHINEQWQSYWVEKFESHDYAPSDLLRRIFWNNPDVEIWYSQNLLTFQADMISEGMAGPVNVVHPRLWCTYRGC